MIDFFEKTLINREKLGKKNAANFEDMNSSKDSCYYVLINVVAPQNGGWILLHLMGQMVAQNVHHIFKFV